MSQSPEDRRPAARFEADLRAEPTGGAPGAGFQLALFSGGKQLGWLGMNSGEWAVLVSDRRNASILERYAYEGTDYYRIQGTSRYLSVSTGSYVGFYNWSGARGWKRDGSAFVSLYNGQKLSLLSPENGYLYAWDAYSALEVREVAPEKPVIVDPPLTGRIEHVVVLMLENRSFDNMLGGLYPKLVKEGLYRGLRGDEKIPLDPRNPRSGSVSVYQGPPDRMNSIAPYPDPGELFADMTKQIFGVGSEADMSGFAWNYAEQPGAPLERGGPPVPPVPGNIMQYYTERSVPWTYYLAQQYAVCDWWFASGPVQTIANRVFAHCGTPGLVPGTNHSRLDNPDFFNGSFKPPFEPPVHDKTVFELLDDAYPNQINWKVYYHDAPLSALCSYVYARWRWDTWDGGNVFHFHETLGQETNFEYDIRNNRLPKYSFIEPRYTNTFGGSPNSNHPGGAGIDVEDPNGSSLPPPISIDEGERLLGTVYSILAKYPETFEKTLLVVIYDEHGGLYDHVPPPRAVSPFTQPVANFPYDRYGVRVPALLVNPLIVPGTIYPANRKPSAPAFDHTSLIRTLTAQFGLKGALTPRSAAAPELRDLIPSAAVVPTRPAPPPLRPETPQPAPQAAAGAPAEGPRNSLAIALRQLLGLERHGRRRNA
ncbi:MAG TPA: alkaline phosphatase family protein [Polyangiaceae bacterium]